MALSYLKRFLRLYAGLFLCAVSIRLAIQGGVGVTPWDVLHMGLADVTGISYGTVNILVGLLILTTSILTFTTSPTQLTDAIERLLRPLAKLHVPVHEFAMMMTIALRFVPTLLEETDKIMSAQKARGADMESGGLIQRVKAMIPILIPLFVSAFRRAYDLAMAMECRCYNSRIKPTKMKQLHAGKRDVIAAVVTLVVLAGVVLGDIFLPALA